MTSVVAFAVRTVLAFPWPSDLDTSSKRGPTENKEVTRMWVFSSSTFTSPDRRKVATPDKDPIDLPSSVFFLSSFPLLCLALFPLDSSPTFLDDFSRFFQGLFHFPLFLSLTFLLTFLLVLSFISSLVFVLVFITFIFIL